jgi:tetratricopeptide (TPR) repeat protein
MKRMLVSLLTACFVVSLAALPTLAAEREPGDVGWAGLAAKDYFRIAKEAMARKDWTKAKQDLVRGLLIEPGDLKAMADLAYVHNALKDYDDALKVCWYILQREDDNKDALREAGYAFLQKKEYDVAAKAFLLALKLDRSDRVVRGYFDRLVSILKSEGKEEAAAQLQEDIRVVTGSDDR